MRRRRFSSHPEVEEAGREASEMRGRSRYEAGGSGGGKSASPSYFSSRSGKDVELGGPATATIQVESERRREREREGVGRMREGTWLATSSLVLPTVELHVFSVIHQAIVFGFSTFRVWVFNIS